eukprot:symbB.v1.2.012640.t1/scaffold853.1/size308060/20
MKTCLSKLPQRILSKIWTRDVDSRIFTSCARWEDWDKSSSCAFAMLALTSCIDVLYMFWIVFASLFAATFCVSTLQCLYFSMAFLELLKECFMFVAADRPRTTKPGAFYIGEADGEAEDAEWEPTIWEVDWVVTHPKSPSRRESTTSTIEPVALTDDSEEEQEEDEVWSTDWKLS